ncbi:MAG TPA: sigma-70 family RNA polymerase sigma factor [Polyangiaceae bacterium]
MKIPLSLTERATAQAAPLVFAEVYAEHAAFVWRSLRRMGVREADLDDVCQDTFMIVHRRLDSYDGSSSVKTWLFGIAMRRASQYRRRAHVRHETLSRPLPEVPASGAQAELLEQKRARLLLDQALDTLDEEKRAVFVLYELEQLPMPEVARAVGCPVQTAYSRLHAARKKVETVVLRSRLTENVR